MLNQQLLFNDMLNHLRKQGKRAFDGTTCAYRSPDGNKCAIGACIRDKNYKPAFEGMSVGNPIIQNALDPKYGTVGGLADRVFLVTAQSALHDDLMNPNTFAGDLEEEAKKFASHYGLEVPSHEN